MINFTMDYLVLSIVKRVMHYEARRRNIAAAAAVGALWAVLVSLFIGIPMVIGLLITYLGVSSLMVWLAFRTKGARNLAKGVVSLYLATFLVSGAMNAIYQYTAAGAYIELILRGRMTEAMPGITFLLLVAGILFGARYLLGWIMEAQRGRTHLYEVTIHYRGKKKTVTALLDTGNRLYEPVTKRPVHVVTYEALKEICESVSSVIYIPFSSVGKQSGMMPGIFLDEIEIHLENEVKKIEKPLVAVCSRPLSEDGQYQMLLHEE